jgi:hypothetical protein
VSGAKFPKKAGGHRAPPKSPLRGLTRVNGACRQSRRNAEGGEAPRAVSRAITGTLTGTSTVRNGLRKKHLQVPQASAVLRSQ